MCELTIDALPRRERELIRAERAERDCYVAGLYIQERHEIVAAWARRTARENRRRKVRLVLDIASFFIGLAGVCGLIAARWFGWF